VVLRGQERQSRHPLRGQINAKYALYVHKFYQKYLYRYLTHRLANHDVLFLNYGYEEDSPMGVPLSASDEADRFFIQLYHRTATQVDLNGKRVLEVGCGHGGGASYLMRTLDPASYTALDVNPAGIAFCQERHNLADLGFVQGDAQNLPFPDQSFDTVINIESSHLYDSFPRFLGEVSRVLRPGGHFLYADFRLSEGLAAWEAQLNNMPMRMLSQKTINAQVVRGMDENSQWWLDMVDRLVPAFLRSFVAVRAHAIVQSTYAELQSGGSMHYRLYCFAKTPAEDRGIGN